MVKAKEKGGLRLKRLQEQNFSLWQNGIGDSPWSKGVFGIPSLSVDTDVMQMDEIATKFLLPPFLVLETHYPSKFRILCPHSFCNWKWYEYLLLKRPLVG